MRRMRKGKKRSSPQRKRVRFSKRSKKRSYDSDDSYESIDDSYDDSEEDSEDSGVNSFIADDSDGDINIVGDKAEEKKTEDGKR